MEETSSMRLCCFLAIVCLTFQNSTAAETPTAATSPAVMDTLHVIASRIPVGPSRLPETVSVIEGDQLRERGAKDLRSALSLVAGVEAVPGGDAGPAGSVPALWGLREFDAFLLVVDDVPWGGAFLPDLPTLDLHDVDRIEVLRGPAPITYGSTSFVGVIHVLHERPGTGNTRAEVQGGSFGTLRGSVATDLDPRLRLAMDGARERFSDDEAGVDRGHARLRAELPRGIHIDAGTTVLRQDPTSPHLRVGGGLRPDIPLDANHNPQGAKLDRTRLHLTASQSNRYADWVASVSHASDDILRGFLEEDPTDDGSPNANGYSQDRSITEVYAEAHHRFRPARHLDLVAGGDLLFGQGREKSRNFRYFAALDGSRRQSSATATTVENTEFEAERTFAGLFCEAQWIPAPRWTLLAGLRWNMVEETREGEAEDSTGTEVPKKVSASPSRLGARLGLTWQTWRDGIDGLALYANYRDTFKPAAIDFGPEAEVDPLKPETARSVEAGARLDLFERHLRLEASAFRMDFENLVVATSVDGRPALRNAGTERFDGAEFGAEIRIAEHTSVRLNYAWHDARFRDYTQDFGGVPTRLDGNSLEMSPRNLASLGMVYHRARWSAEAIASYVGERYLNKRNTARAEDYVTLDAAASLRLGRSTLRLTGRNLTDRRDPVAESELGESQCYRLPARAVELSTGWDF